MCMQSELIHRQRALRQVRCRLHGRRRRPNVLPKVLPWVDYRHGSTAGRKNGVGMSNLVFTIVSLERKDRSVLLRERKQ